jgi:CheY-like chemotaxis protein
MSSDELSQKLVSNLPFLRRYARALTGSQGTGDRYALATMEALIAAPDEVDESSVKIDLFRAFHKIWSTSGQPVESDISKVEGRLRETRAHERISALMPNTREALLLHVVEGFSIGDLSTIMDVSPEEAEKLVQHAIKDLRDMVTGDIMIIEDEAVIAMDLEAIVASMGHAVTGVARTKTAAIELAERRLPDLIMADIQLADGSSGIDAVNALLKEHGDRPVIFITAFPERLLTGERPEPAFLITKPYSEEQVRAAVSQAMFFATTEELSPV